MSLLPGSGDCCGVQQCCTEEIVNIPGPQGPPGAACTPCADGENAFTSTTANFTQPAVGSNVSVEVVDSDWIVPGQELYIENGGYYLAVSKADSTHVTVKNRGYTGNAAPAVIVASSAHVGPAGIKGADGTGAGAAFLIANNLSEGTPATMRSNLGLGTMAVETAANYLTKAGNLSGLASAATSRTNLGVAIGTNVQAYNALLQVIAALSPTVADRFIYTTGVDTVALGVAGTYGRSLLATTNATVARTTLGGILPGYGLLGSLSGVDLNVGTSDSPITIEASRYIIDRIIVANASVNLTTATAAVYTLPTLGGTAIALTQALSALTASGKYFNMALEAVTGTDTFTTNPIYFECVVPQGAAATADVYVYGWALS